MEEWRYGSTILSFGIKWRRMVSFTFRPLYPRENRARYPLDKRFGGPQRGLDVVEKNLASAGIRSPAFNTIKYGIKRRINIS
jgi:hypothetical protein